MKRSYVLYIAKMMAESEDADNKSFGELLLRVIPEDDKAIPQAVIDDIKGELQRGIEMMGSEKDGIEACDWSDQKALDWIAGSPYVDDPRPGWRKRDLAMFARGYAVGRAIQKMNDDEAMNMTITGLSQIEKHLTESK